MSVDWAKIKHFTEKEFDSPDAPGSGSLMDPTLIRLLDELRERVGTPLVVNSGYRTAAYNASLEHSVDGSAHTLGRAVDLAARSGTERFALVFHALALGIKRIGVGRTFVHLDTDPSKPANVVWTYT